MFNPFIVLFLAYLGFPITSSVIFTVLKTSYPVHLLSFRIQGCYTVPRVCLSFFPTICKITPSDLRAIIHIKYEPLSGMIYVTPVFVYPSCLANRIDHSKPQTHNFIYARKIKCFFPELSEDKVAIT